MSAVLIALMVLLVLLFALGAVLVLTKVMKREAERVRAGRPAKSEAVDAD